MEGPSLYLAKQQLRPFKRKLVLNATGNTTKIDKERLIHKEIKDIFSWGKHLLFQFDTFALRTHFLLYGTFAACVNDVWVTGDYKKTQSPRLTLSFDNGTIELYNCSIKLLEEKRLKKLYDYSVDIMSSAWDNAAALKKVLNHPAEEIADVLLDQSIFSGVGNIIKNEVLSLVKINPKRKVGSLSTRKINQIIAETRAFSLQFYKWRKQFVLRKNLKVHRRSVCPYCERKLLREKTGKRIRWSYWCPHCQILK